MDVLTFDVFFVDGNIDLDCAPLRVGIFKVAKDLLMQRSAIEFSLKDEVV